MPFVALQGRPLQSATIEYAITPNPVRPLNRNSAKHELQYQKNGGGIGACRARLSISRLRISDY